MATRATYFISSDSWNNELTCFYIHWDGYPEGAAEYFWKMHKVKNKRGGFAGQFVRGNELAEFTFSHECHGDTEYRYTLNKDGQLTAWKFNFDDDTWKVFYQGAWYEFVNNYRKSHEKLYLFKKESSCDSFVLTLAEAKFYAYEKMILAQQYADRRMPEASNRMEEEAKYIEAQLHHIICTMPQDYSEELNEITEIEIANAISSSERSISFVLSVDDIKSVRPHIDDAKATIILNRFKNNHRFLDLVKQEFNNIYEGIYGLGGC